MTKHRKIFTKKEIKEAIKNGKTMGGAAKFLNVSWRTFKREAQKYNLYVVTKQFQQKYELQDILNGKHPQYPTYKIGVRLVKEGFKEYKCESCGISEYNGKHISLELNHIDGNNSNHSLLNLEFLCPNCHSQTPTYRSKKLKLI